MDSDDIKTSIVNGVNASNSNDLYIGNNQFGNINSNKLDDGRVYIINAVNIENANQTTIYDIDFSELDSFIEAIGERNSNDTVRYNVIGIYSSEGTTINKIKLVANEIKELHIRDKEVYFELYKKTDKIEISYSVDEETTAGYATTVFNFFKSNGFTDVTLKGLVKSDKPVDYVNHIKGDSIHKIIIGYVRKK